MVLLWHLTERPFSSDAMMEYLDVEVGDFSSSRRRRCIRPLSEGESGVVEGAAHPLDLHRRARQVVHLDLMGTKNDIDVHQKFESTGNMNSISLDRGHSLN